MFIKERIRAYMCKFKAKK